MSERECASPMDWRHQAACLYEDPELFFPIGCITPAALAQIERAKAVCAGCPVIAECLAWALETGQDAGVWGGLGEDERRLARRARRRAARFRGAVSGTAQGEQSS